MNSNFFWLPQKILDYQSLEAAQVPEIDKGETQECHEEESVGSLNKVLEAVALDVAGEEHPDEEGDNVDHRVYPPLDGVLVSVRDQVEDPGLVEHGVKLGDETEHAKALTNPSVDDPADGGDGPDVVDSKEGELGGHHHVHCLGHVDAEAEQEAVGGQGRGGQQEVRLEAVRGEQSQQRPGPRDARTDARQEGRPPLENPLGARPHGLGDEGPDKGVPDNLEDRSEEEDEVEQGVPLHCLHSLRKVEVRRGQHDGVV